MGGLGLLGYALESYGANLSHFLPYVAAAESPVHLVKLWLKKIFVFIHTGKRNFLTCLVILCIFKTYLEMRGIKRGTYMSKKTIEHTELLVLSLLSTADMYGYQMITELERRSDQTFRMKEGTLYPILKKMENGGYLKTYSEEVAGRTRKYYHISDKGLDLLKTEEKEWREYSRGINSVLGGAIIPA